MVHHHKMDSCPSFLINHGQAVKRTGFDIGEMFAPMENAKNQLQRIGGKSDLQRAVIDHVEHKKAGYADKDNGRRVHPIMNLSPEEKREKDQRKNKEEPCSAP